MGNRISRIVLGLALLGFFLPSTGCKPKRGGHYGGSYTDVFVGFDCWPDFACFDVFDDYEEYDYYEYYEVDTYYTDDWYGCDNYYYDDYWEDDYYYDDFFFWWD